MPGMQLNGPRETWRRRIQFLTYLGIEPELVLVEPQQRGPTSFFFNPVVQRSAVGKLYSGKRYFNSGVIWGTMVPLPGLKNYTLAFDTPGAYHIFASFHDDIGMKGQISVVSGV